MSDWQTEIAVLTRVVKGGIGDRYEKSENRFNRSVCSGTGYHK